MNEENETPPPPVPRCVKCDQPGVWIPVLLFYPSILHGPSKPIGQSTKHHLCDEHKETARVRDVVKDCDYEAAEKICANRRWPWPDRTRTRMKMIPYAGSQLEKHVNAERAERAKKVATEN